jgi:hypothetical protein
MIASIRRDEPYVESLQQTLGPCARISLPSRPG